MLTYLLLGSGLAFAAAVQPGPLQAFLVSRAVAGGWRRTLPACLSPLLSDGPIALVALVVLGQLPGSLQRLVRGAGGVFLVMLAWTAFGQWRRPSDAGAAGSAPRTLVEAAIVNLLNPNPYLAWTLVLGPAVLGAWAAHPAFAAAFVLAFYGTMIVTLAAIILLAGSTRVLGIRVRRALVGVSVLILAGLGLYLLAGAILDSRVGPSPEPAAQAWRTPTGGG